MQLRTIAEQGGAGREDAKRQRRHVIRHECTVDIQMLVRHAAGNSDLWSTDSIAVKGKLLDLSHDGASLFTRTPFETGQELNLRIQLRDKTEIKTKAKVRWIKAAPEKGGSASGVMFSDIDQKDQKCLATFLGELDKTMGF